MVLLMMNHVSTTAIATGAKEAVRLMSPDSVSNCISAAEPKRPRLEGSIPEPMVLSLMKVVIMPWKRFCVPNVMMNAGRAPSQ